MTEIERPKFMAETDAMGQVTHVSLSMKGWALKPSAGANSDPLQNVMEASEFHGASQRDIADWLHRNWHA